MTRTPMFMLLALVPASAAASTEAQIALLAASGFTDNALGAAQDSPTAAPDSDLFFTVSPTLVLVTETPRLVQRASFGAGVSRYVNESQANSLVLNGGLRLDYDASKTVHSSLNLTASYADVATLAPAGVVGAVPTGGGQLLSFGAETSLAKDFSASWRGVDDLHLALQVPLDDGTLRRNLAIENGVATQLSHRRDAFELRLAGGVHLFEAPVEDDATVVNTVLSTSGSWFHELDRFWGLLLGGGAAVVLGDDTATVAPLARAALTRDGERVLLSVELTQAVQANALVAETLSTSTATVGLTTHFGPDDALALNFSAGAAHSRTVGQSPERTVNSARGTVHLGWAVSESLAVNASYELLYQVGDDAMGAETTLLRNAVLAGLSATWPHRVVRSEPEGIRLRVRQSEERDRELRER